MSDYYWASQDVQSPPCKTPSTGSNTASAASAALVDIPPGVMRTYFVGFLFAVGAMLFCYRGYTVRENWALNFAGLMAWGIALFPMDWTCSNPKFNKHGFCAIMFFLAIAYVCMFCSRATLVLINDERKRAIYKATYSMLAIAMAAAPAFAWLFNTVLQKPNSIFWVELTGIYAFATYWVVKILEVESIGTEKDAIERS